MKSGSCMACSTSLLWNMSTAAVAGAAADQISAHLTLLLALLVSQRLQKAPSTTPLELTEAPSK